MSFFFLKLVEETQNLLSPEATRDHKSIKLLIFQPLRADLLCTLHYETPCILNGNLSPATVRPQLLVQKKSV